MFLRRQLRLTYRIRGLAGRVAREGTNMMNESSPAVQPGGDGLSALS